MGKSRKDPLLTSADAIIKIIRVLLILAMAALAFGVIVDVIGHGYVVQKVVAAGGTPGAAWGVTWLLALMTALFAMAERFFRRLGEIVASVEKHDPFELANAARLERMGWLALAMNCIALLLGMLSPWMARFRGEGMTHAQSGIGFSFTGLILTLVLFILARVFRQGAAMRDDLEGTV